MRLPALLAAFIALLPAAARAQTVNGELVERGAGRPIPGALVVLLDSADARRSTALTDAAGRFVLHAPGPGTYRLRAERVGFRSTTSPPLALGVDQALAYRMEGDAAPVTLAGITAQGERRCRPRPGAGPATATLWEEVRKALTAAEHTARAGELRYDLVTYARHLHPASATVLLDQRERRAGEWLAPFFSTAADSLSREGFVRAVGDSVAFDAPDADVLLSDRFLADHCFRVEEDRRRPGLVGLAFEPVPARSGFREVAGVLWLERGTARLRSLEYRYVNVPPAISGTGAGGQVEFERLATGQWIVRTWWIRMPQYEEETGPGGVKVIGRLTWLRVEGGEVVGASVPLADGAPRAGRVTGVAWDSLATRPLAGARVFLLGTGWEAVADSAGRFVIDGVPAGRYAASFDHPEPAGWGALPDTGAVTVEAGAEARLALATASPETQAGRLCTPDVLREHRGVVVGTLTQGGRPRSASRVTVFWLRPRLRTESVGTMTDERGFFVLCGVPTRATLDLEAQSGGPVFRERIHLEGAHVFRRDIQLPTSGDAAAERSR